jgi:hypothetical protein
VAVVGRPRGPRDRGDFGTHGNRADISIALDPAV